MCPSKHLSTWENNSFSVILSFYIRRGCQVNRSVPVQPEITVGSRNMLMFAICRGSSSAGPFLEDVPEAGRDSILHHRSLQIDKRLSSGLKEKQPSSGLAQAGNHSSNLIAFPNYTIGEKQSCWLVPICEDPTKQGDGNSPWLGHLPRW